jgi:hypothetical protein
MTFDKAKEIHLQAIVYAFPEMLRRAVADWAKFKVGVENNTFTQDDKTEILNWFKSFPKLWETIRPNFDPLEKPVMSLTPADAELVHSADRFVEKLGGEIKVLRNLGVAPVIIAGIAIAGAFGIAGAIWAIGYSQKQSNISKMIDQAVAGNLPASILETAVKKENESIFGGVLGSVKWIIMAGALFMLWPQLQPLVQRALKKVG